ncbi:DNA/RNA helicase domain-containing protein [Arenimonas sp.]|uniref:DNA/RNA helicase domain-containing protein n=1 Tax=Arenimonas sp. TaxID=1872635 RepID=UPI0025BE6175|nr:DNA/RNA helicase domain-containing protein [Arenimonas sp.]
MIIYSGTRAGFLKDADGFIEERIASAYLTSTGRYAGQSEQRSWKESLSEMAKVLRAPGLPDDMGVGVEYQIPQSAKRIDMLLTGHDKDDNPHLVIVELKQWSNARVSDKDGIVIAQRGGPHEREGPHPCYQAWSYAALLEGFNEAIYDGDIRLRPCAYLHNYRRDGVIDDARYNEYLEKAPLFLRGEPEQERLRDFIRRHIHRGDKASLLYQIENGRIRPSRQLADAVAGMLADQPEFVLVDEQKVAYETALSLADRAESGSKQVLLIEGGPGTGKSVVAVNLLAELTRRRKTTRYVSKNAAPRTVYAEKLRGKRRRNEVQALFGGSGAFVDAEPDAFDVLVVDEAHRLNAKSGLYGNLGEHQVKEIMQAARCSIFFVDDAQRVTLADIGQSNEIVRWAEQLGADLTRLELPSQFRCAGSDGYLAWLDQMLGIRETANDTFDPGALDFRVFETATELHDRITELNQAANRARVVAGYCWDWNSKKRPDAWDIEIPEQGYRRQWNLGSDGSLWIMAPESVAQVGCIHTCQGLEVDYIGVILGPDLVARDGRLVSVPTGRSKMDRSIRGWKKSAKQDPTTLSRVDKIIRNTYRTLMTRGMKGCFITSTDAETREFLRAAAKLPQ